jgi:hypothetical protein
VERWDLVAGRRGRPLSTRNKGFPFALGVHPRLPEVLVLTASVVVSRWDLITGRRLWETSLQTKEAAEVAGYIEERQAKVAFLPGEDRVLVKHERLYVLDARTGRILETPERDPSEPVLEVPMREHAIVKASEDGRRLAVIDPDAGSAAWFDRTGERHVLCEAGAP